MTSLYPSTRSSNCIFINCILINLKQRPVKITGKNIKSYATAQVHFPREREGSLTAKSPNLSFTNMIRLNRTYYSLLKFSQAKLLKIGSFGQNSNKLKQNPLNSPIYSACFRHLPRQRTFRNSSGSCKFCAVRPHSPQMTRNSPIC